MKIKNTINKLVGALFFRTKKPDLNLTINPDKSQLSNEIKQYLGHFETKSAMYDYQNALNAIYSIRDKPKERVEQKVTKENQSQAQTDAINSNSSSNLNSNFFNKYSLEILQNTTCDNLVDLSCKSFVGSIGMQILKILYSRHTPRPRKVHSHFENSQTRHNRPS